MRYALRFLATLVAVLALGTGAWTDASAPLARPRPVRGSVLPELVVVAAGDLVCERSPGSDPNWCQYDDVAALVRAEAPDRFLALGDIQYETGALEDFQDFYDPFFGAFRPFTSPVPGNHEYDGSPNAQGYFDYFGPDAAPAGGYTSFDLGSWHLIALNSELCFREGCGPGSAQYQWLAQDLAAHAGASCTLAFFHHPRFTTSGAQGRVRPFWELLYAAHADVVLSGHAHRYERWARQSPVGVRRARGIRQFVVGTGGRSLHPLGPQRPESFVRGQDDSFGALRLDLRDGSFGYRWLTAPGQPAFHDADATVPCV